MTQGHNHSNAAASILPYVVLSTLFHPLAWTFSLEGEVPVQAFSKNLLSNPTHHRELEGGSG
jgi:hypothetical protein